MLQLMYSAGLRVSELVTVPTSSLDLEEGLLRVRGKGDKERIVPIGERAADRVALFAGAVSLDHPR